MDGRFRGHDGGAMAPTVPNPTRIKSFLLLFFKKEEALTFRQ